MDAAQVVGDSHAASSVMLLWIGRSLLFGTALASLTYLLTRLSRRRIVPALEAGLWLIVLVKFLVPVGPAWSFSLGSVHSRLFSSPSARDATVTESTAFDAVAFDTIDLPFVVVDVPDQRPSAPPVPAISDRPSVAARAATPRQHWTPPLAALYLLCIAGLFALRLHGYRKLVAQCRLLPASDERTGALVLSVCRRLGVRRVPLIRISDDRSAPFVMGFVRPLLVLSRDLLVRPDELETVIVHEIAHLRRGDTFVRYLQWLAGTLLFFWPVVAWVNRRLDVVREYACDEWALRQGKLTAHQYARCLLRVAQPGRYPRLAYRPCNMATNSKTIERRIDMILQLPRCSSKRRTWHLASLAFLLAWAGFALTGAVARPEPAPSGPDWPITVSAVRVRAADVYALAGDHEAADLNQDGVLSYLEKDTYLVALAMDNATAFMDEFPYADRNHSGNLDIIEARDVIRAVTLIAYADRRASALTEPVLALEFCHEALEAQEWLLANLVAEPQPSDMDNIWSVLRRVQSPPGGYSARMLDHGGPIVTDPVRKREPGVGHPFQELQGNIAALEARLAIAQDDETVTRLELMLAKLEALLARLQE